jgi:hypothetical protein
MSVAIRPLPREHNTMSTRATYRFIPADWQPEVTIYIHYDGYGAAQCDGFEPLDLYDTGHRTQVFTHSQAQVYALDQASEAIKWCARGAIGNASSYRAAFNALLDAMALVAKERGMQ